VRRLLGAALATALLLAGCASVTDPPPEVHVTGDVGQEPTLVYTPPLPITRVTSEVIWEGSGPRLVDGGPVLLNFRLEKATDATLVKETYSGVPKPFTMTPETLSQDLYDALSGHSVGARILLLLPATSATSRSATVMVVDILPTRASGEAVPPREGMPAVTLARDGEPKIAAPQGDPPGDPLVQALIKGDGAQVEKDATVTIQYAGVRWSDGSAFDSTWVQGEPRSFDLTTGVLPGLVEQTVGSQVMLVIPPASGGVVGAQDDTLVLVVDILAATTPSTAPKKPVPAPAPAPTKAG